MKKKIMPVFALAVLLFSLSAIFPLVSAKPAGLPRGSAYIYVTSQDKFYDTIVPISQDKGLPWNPNAYRSFQELRPSTAFPGISETDYGPGDPGYVGGRWWIDSNPNGYQDADDTFFLCPLLGPGRDAT